MSRGKFMGVELLAVLLVLTAMGTGSIPVARATATTANGFWRAEGTKLTSGGSKSLICEGAPKAAIKLKGTIAGAETELTASGVECWSLPEIKQNGEHAESTMRLEFTGVHVVKPAGCGTSSFSTTTLTGKVMMEGGTTYIGFATPAGETIAKISIVGCAAEGTYPLKGTFFGEYLSGTGTSAAVHPLWFTSAIQETAGGSLTLGGNSAVLSAELLTTLLEAKSWSVNES